MGEAGILHEDDRVELIEGELVEMTAIGTRHFSCVNRLTRMLVMNVGDEAIVSVQNPVRLNEYTAVPVSIDPCVLASGNETIFEGSEIEGSLSRRRRHTQPGGSDDLLSVGAYHKTLVKETSGDRRCAAKSDPWQALQEG
jgi:hypothetical protein